MTQKSSGNGHEHPREPIADTDADMPDSTPGNGSPPVSTPHKVTPAVSTTIQNITRKHFPAPTWGSDNKSDIKHPSQKPSTTSAPTSGEESQVQVRYSKNRSEPPPLRNNSPNKENHLEQASDSRSHSSSFSQEEEKPWITQPSHSNSANSSPQKISPIIMSTRRHHGVQNLLSHLFRNNHPQTTNCFSPLDKANTLSTMDISMTRQQSLPLLPQQDQKL